MKRELKIKILNFLFIIFTFFQMATMDPSDLINMKQYSGIDNSQTMISERLYGMMNGIYNKVNGGWAGNLEMVIYVILAAMIIIIFNNNMVVFQDINGNVAVQPSPAIQTNQTIFQILCGTGLLMCIIRITWSNVFTAQRASNRLFELIFSLVIWGILIAALVLSLSTRKQLNAAAALSQNKATAGAVGAVSATSISNALMQNQTEYILCAVGIGLTTLYTAYNVYNLLTPAEVVSDSEYASKNPAPAQ